MDELLDHAPCGFLTLTDSGRIIEINATLLKLLGYGREELNDEQVRKLFSAAGNIFYQTHFFPLLKLQEKLEEVYLALRCKTGEEIPVLVNAVRHERAGAVFYDFVLVPMHHRNEYEDEILRAKKDAETANRSKEEFLSAVSHDLRTPLTAILGWMEILKDREDDAELVRKAMKVIRRSAEAQQALIEDVLDFARISSDKLMLDIAPINLAEIIESAIELVSNTANVKEISLQTSFDPNVFVTGDGGRLQQVWWNLLSNAIKFTPPNGQVNVYLVRENSNAVIKVSDTGRGINSEFLPYVFERFKQEDGSGSPSFGGLGLGLAITRHIVELHGGTIGVESPGENKGATFTVILPAAITQAHASG